MMDVLLYTRRNELIGSSRSFIENRTATLSNIYVRPDFTRLGYGSILMEETERNAKSMFQTDSMQLLAWQPSGGYEVIDFYKKNGYKMMDHRTELFDDYSQIFDLMRMHKSI